MSSKKIVTIVLSMSLDSILVSSVSGPYTELHECVYLIVLVWYINALFTNKFVVRF